MKITLSLIGILLGSGSAFAVQHKVVEGEHLWSLAARYYGNSFQWRVIARANSNIKDPHWIYPGQILEIPDQAPQAVEASASVSVPEAPEEEVDEDMENALQTPRPRAEVPKQAPFSNYLPAETPGSDDLSRDIPPQMAGNYPSLPRLKAPAGWSPDGKVVETGGNEVIVATGDSFQAKFKPTASTAAGDRFTVYRQVSALESDSDRRATYLQKIGLAELQESVGSGIYRLRVVTCGDSVGLGDLLKKDN